MSSEIVLYNIKGKPIAFIQFGFESVVYLMDGQAVAYLEHIGSDRSRIWGLNGKHLGWFDDAGIVYNAKALRIGFTREKYNRVFDKKVVIKPHKQKTPILMPVFSMSDSNEEFERFLKQGVK